MKTNNYLTKTLVQLINGYQYIISPILPRTCRFYPTCSEYTKQALVKFGLAKGLMLGLKRIVRCNPFCAGGFDPVEPMTASHKCSHSHNKCSSEKMENNGRIDRIGY